MQHAQLTPGSARADFESRPGRHVSSKIKAGERFQLRQIGSVQIDVIETNPNDGDLL